MSTILIWNQWTKASSDKSITVLTNNGLRLYKNVNVLYVCVQNIQILNNFAEKKYIYKHENDSTYRSS